jgi:hypothetical protein
MFLQSGLKLWSGSALEEQRKFPFFQILAVQAVDAEKIDLCTVRIQQKRIILRCKYRS